MEKTEQGIHRVSYPRDVPTTPPVRIRQHLLGFGEPRPVLPLRRVYIYRIEEWRGGGGGGGGGDEGGGGGGRLKDNRVRVKVRVRVRG
jgi:hypothetical protein